MRLDETLYVFAVSAYGDSAVVGASARIAQDGEVQITGVSIVNQGLHVRVSFKNPAVNGFVVKVRSDHYVKDIEEEDDTVRSFHITRSKYDSDGLIVLPGMSHRECYVSVFARMGIGAGMSFTEAAEAYIDDRPKEKIVYTFKKVFLSNNVTFIFKSQSGRPFELPEVQIAWCRGRVPHMTGDARVLDTFGPLRVTSEYTRVVQLPKGKDVYIEAYPTTGADARFASRSGYRV